MYIKKYVFAFSVLCVLPFRVFRRKLKRHRSSRYVIIGLPIFFPAVSSARKQLNIFGTLPVAVDTVKKVIPKSPPPFESRDKLVSELTHYGAVSADGLNWKSGSQRGRLRTLPERLESKKETPIKGL